MTRYLFCFHYVSHKTTRCFLFLIRVSTIFNATSNGQACSQAILASTGLTSEDCLTLNVFRPVSASPSSTLPVLVWVHGGSFTLGSTALYDPWRLVAVNNLVVVSVQVCCRTFSRKESQSGHFRLSVRMTESYPMTLYFNGLLLSLSYAASPIT